MKFVSSKFIKRTFSTIVNLKELSRNPRFFHKGRGFASNGTERLFAWVHCNKYISYQIDSSAPVNDFGFLNLKKAWWQHRLSLDPCLNLRFPIWSPWIGFSQPWTGPLAGWPWPRVTPSRTVLWDCLARSRPVPSFSEKEELVSNSAPSRLLAQVKKVIKIYSHKYAYERFARQVNICVHNELSRHICRCFL